MFDKPTSTIKNLKLILNKLYVKIIEKTWIKIYNFYKLFIHKKR